MSFGETEKMLLGCDLVLVNAGNVEQEGLVSNCENAHQSLTQIYVMMNRFHIRSDSLLHYRHLVRDTCSWRD